MGKIKQVNEKEELLCCKCKIYQHSCEFHNDKNQPCRKYKSSECKTCQRIRKQKYWRLKEEFNLELLLRGLLNGCKQRVLGHTTKFGKYKGMELNITFDDLLLLYYKQKGKCAISGIEMSYIIGGGRKDTNISIDRLDNSKGYVLNNIQLVCVQVNMMKGTLNKERLVFFCKNIVNNE